MGDKPKLVMDDETRDLCRLACDRQRDAIMSVVQLARDPAQAYAIYQAAASEAFGERDRAEAALSTSQAEIARQAARIEEPLAALDRVGDWISGALPIPTTGATANLIRLRNAVASIRAALAKEAE